MKNWKALNTFVVLCLTAGTCVSITSCASDKTESAAESLNDASISEHVVSALAATSEYKYSDVQVNTFKGRVQLSGFVDSGSHKDQAGIVTKQVEGVKDVINNITVK